MTHFGLSRSKVSKVVVWGFLVSKAELWATMSFSDSVWDSDFEIIEFPEGWKDERGLPEGWKDLREVIEDIFKSDSSAIMMRASDKEIEQYKAIDSICN